MQRLAAGLALGAGLAVSAVQAQFAVQDLTSVYANTSQTLEYGSETESTQPASFSHAGSGNTNANADVSYTYGLDTTFSHDATSFSIDLGITDPIKHPYYGSARSTKLQTDTRVDTGFWNNSAYADPETVTFSGGSDPFLVTFAVEETQFDYSVTSTLSDSFSIYLSLTYYVKQFSSTGVLKQSSTVQYIRQATNANSVYQLDTSNAAATFNLVTGDYIEITATHDAEVSYTMNGHETSAQTGSLAADLAGSFYISDLTGGMSFSADQGSSLTLSAVPEPSTYAAIFGALALGGAVWQRRRRREVV